ncbi:MAG: hypothetical protein Q4E65_10175 [Clostridia bacterium]|nr:hypothetical protein [Clostridia bacterium]
MQQTLSNVLAAIDAGRMPHACFFCCTDAGLAEDAAARCAQRFCGCAALADFPDYFDISCPIAVDTLRELLGELAKKTFSDGKRCVRFTQAHQMSEAAQNIFLKTLEEPPRDTLFLLCGNLAAMLPTIRSRCCVIRLGTPAYEDIRAALLARGANDADAMLYARVADSLEHAWQLCSEAEAREERTRAIDAFCELLRGMPPYALTKTLQSDKANARAHALHLTGYFLSFLRDMLACKEGLPLRNTDLRDKLKALAPHFTSGRINGMIENVTAATSRLYTPASVGATLDKMMTQILEEMTYSNEKH